MQMRGMILLGTAVCIALTVACSAHQEKAGGWVPPAGGVVQSKKTAIAIARAVWLSMHPELEANIGSEEVWQTNMDAVLHGDTWEIATKMKPGELGGGLYIYISRHDGHVVDVRLTQ